eukprot:3543713-Rhodomonas_salina.4
MYTEPALCLSVDDAIFALFPEDTSEACEPSQPRDAHQTWGTDKVFPSIAIDSLELSLIHISEPTRPRLI